MADSTQRLLRRLRLRDLETLATVARAGGMRKAADTLQLSQPAVSKAIAALEDAVGFPLLDRSRQGVAVTTYGEALIRHAAIMFDQLQRGVRELEHLRDPEGGFIKIACAETLNAGIVAAAVEHMTRLYPRVGFSVDSGDAPLLISHFLLERVSDCVLARPFGASIPTEVHTEALFHERLQVVVSRNSPLATRRRLRLAELADEPWILSLSEATGDSPVVSAFRAAGLELPRQKVLTGSLNVRYTLLATGRFVTVMPHSVLRFGAARAALKVLPIEIGRWPTPVMILRLVNRGLSPAVQTFLDIVRELAAPLAD